MQVQPQPVAAAQQRYQHGDGAKRPRQIGGPGDAGNAVAAERQRAAHESVVTGDIDDVDGEHDAKRHRGVAGAAVTGTADKQHETQRRCERQDAQKQDAMLQSPAAEPDKGTDRRRQQP